MTIDFGFDVGNDPPPRHVNPTVSDDGYMAVGGQLVYNHNPDDYMDLTYDELKKYFIVLEMEKI